MFTAYSKLVSDYACFLLLLLFVISSLQCHSYIKFYWTMYFFHVLKSVASRVAEEMGVKLGEEVGYTIRFEDVTNPVWLPFPPKKWNPYGSIYLVVHASIFDGLIWHFLSFAMMPFDHLFPLAVDTE